MKSFLALTTVLASLFLFGGTLLSIGGVTATYDPSTPNTIGVKAKVTTAEKDALGGSFFNHNYYPGPTMDDWAGGPQVVDLHLDNLNDGRGDFQAHATYGPNGGVSLKALAQVSGSATLSAGWVEFLVAQKVTNSSGSALTRTFTSNLHASIVQNGFETFATSEVWAFTDQPAPPGSTTPGATFRLEDPYVMVNEGVPTKGDWTTLGDARIILEMYDAGMNQTVTGNQTFTLAAGETIYMLASLRFQADEAGSYVDALNTFTIDVNDPSGLDFGAVPEPASSALALVSGGVLFLLRRRRSDCSRHR